MARLRQLMADFLANGKIESNELAMLREALYADNRINREELNFLAEMHKRIERVTPAFEQFFYQAVKDHLLQDGNIGAEEAAWLRQLIIADGKAGDREKKLLRELGGEARQVGQEFQALCDEFLK